MDLGKSKYGNLLRQITSMLSSFPFHMLRIKMDVALEAIAEERSIFICL